MIAKKRRLRAFDVPGFSDVATPGMFQNRPQKCAENISEWESEFQERRTEKTNEREESSVEALFSGSGTLRPGLEIFGALA